VRYSQLRRAVVRRLCADHAADNRVAVRPGDRVTHPLAETIHREGPPVFRVDDRQPIPLGRGQRCKQLTVQRNGELSGCPLLVGGVPSGSDHARDILHVCKVYGALHSAIKVR
jgi:hypothetical protein